MIKAIISDFSRVLIFAKDKNFTGKLNDLHEEVSKEEGYDVWNYFYLNEELLDFYKELSGKFGMYIFTTRYLQEQPSLKEKLQTVFKDVFIGKTLGLSKQESGSYKKIIEKIGLPAGDILYIDDKDYNIKAAREAGLRVIQYISTENLKEEIKQYL